MNAAVNVYKNLAKIFGIILLLLGIGMLIGANYDHGFVKEQLGAQKIEMPTKEALDAQVKSGRITQEDADILGKFAGKEMTTGPQAKAYADNYIYKHMLAGAKAAGVPDDKATYAGIGDMATEATNQLKAELKQADPNADDKAIAAKANAEIANKATTNATAKKVQQLNDLRMNTFLNGNSLRGMLLNAYGWYLVGTIAKVAGWVLIIGGALLALWGFMNKGTTENKNTVKTTEAAPVAGSTRA